MSELIFSQWTLWAFSIIGLIGIWVIWALMNRKRPDSLPTPVAVIASIAFPLVLLMVYGLGLRYGTDLDDHCILNGHVAYAVYEESWTEEYTEVETYQSGTDSKGNPTYSTRVVTKTRFHPPSWESRTTVGSFNIDEAMYVGYVRRFGNEALTDSHHSGQISHGDGRTYRTRWDGRLSSIVPISTRESVINWVKASQGTVYRTKGGDNYQIPAYPELVSVPRGIRFPRLILSGVQPPKGWVEPMEWDLDVLADAVGESKQSNPIVILTNSDQGYYEALKDRWIGGKKNDVIVLIGVKQWPKVEWVRVMSWSKDDGFEPKLASALSEISLDDRWNLTHTLESNIMKNFERKPMATFEYLKADIVPPTWISVVSALLMAATYVILILIGNSRPSYGYPSYNRMVRRWG